MANYRFRAVVDIDVKNADSESEAREKAFGIMSGANATPARGRTPSGPKASVTGVIIESDPQAKCSSVALQNAAVNREWAASQTIADVTE